MNEKTIEDALNLLISGELDLVDTALGEVSNIKTYAEAGILTRDSGLVLRMPWALWSAGTRTMTFTRWCPP